MRLTDRGTLIQKYREGERHLSYRYRRAKRGRSPAWINLQCNMFPAPRTGTSNASCIPMTSRSRS
jgi:hypothetical protein